MKRTAIRKAFVGAVNFSCKRWGALEILGGKKLPKILFPGSHSTVGISTTSLSKNYLAKFGAGKVPVPTIIVL